MMQVFLGTPKLSVARTIFNTWAGDTDKSEVQCEHHPTALFCTDDALLSERSQNGSFACEVLKTPLRYDYDHLTYKKLQCLTMVRLNYLRLLCVWHISCIKA